MSVTYDFPKVHVSHSMSVHVRIHATHIHDTLYIIYVLALHQTQIMVTCATSRVWVRADGEVWRCSGPSITEAETACAGRLVFRLTSIHTLRITIT